MRIIVQDNLWFSGPPSFANYVLDGQDMIPFEPLLGRSDSSDASAKSQELQWLLRYTGRSGTGLVVAQEWIKPEDEIDRNLDLWLPIFERHGRRARWCVFYDPVLAVKQRGLGDTPPFDFSRLDLLAMWRSDLDHLERHFSTPKYWALGERPVLYVWAVHGGIVNADQAFAEADGRGLYILGDVLGGRREPAGMRGVTGFVAAVPGIVRPGDLRDIGGLLPELEQEFAYWSGQGYDFFPASSLQYDDTDFQRALGSAGQAPIRLLARGRDDLRRTLKSLRRNAADGAVMLGTANGWAEGTTCLPTKRSGPEFGAGRIAHYHFAHLEALHEVLFPGVSAYDGPKLEVIRRRRNRVIVKLTDVDALAKVRVRPRAALLKEKIRSGFERRLVVAPEARIKVRNLDRRRAEIET
ncbi:MAG: hypothetical protein ACE5GX_17485 [Thermoanaerobaculia bacterium]